MVNICYPKQITDEFYQQYYLPEFLHKFKHTTLFQVVSNDTTARWKTRFDKRFHS